MSEMDADFSATLSSELIAEIVQEYFNEEMFKRPVRIVDQAPIQGDSGGYIFMLAFVKDVELHPIELEVERRILEQTERVDESITRKVLEQGTPVSYSTPHNSQRNGKDKFTTKRKVTHG